MVLRAKPSWEKQGGSKRLKATCAAIAGCLSISRAQGASIYSEQGKLSRGQEVVKTLDVGVFGDNVSLYDEALEFVQTDVSLPGNNALPVAVSRRLKTRTRTETSGAFGDWDLEIPHIKGTFSRHHGWKSGRLFNNQHCTGFRTQTPTLATS